MDWSGAALTPLLLACPVATMLMTPRDSFHGALLHDQKRGDVLSRAGESR